MTQDRIKESIADIARKALHVDPPYIETNAQAAAAFDADHEREWQAQTIATAVMALVGPKPLVWVPDGTYDCVWDCVNTDNNQYRLMHDEPSNEYAALIDGVWHWCDTQALAQAAAQAHADAAHWGNTGLGDCHAEGA